MSGDLEYGAAHKCHALGSTAAVAIRATCYKPSKDLNETSNRRRGTFCRNVNGMRGIDFAKGKVTARYATIALNFDREILKVPFALRNVFLCLCFTD